VKNVNSHPVTCVCIIVSYNKTANINVNKKAVLSQRWPRNAPCRHGCRENLRAPWLQ